MNKFLSMVFGQNEKEIIYSLVVEFVLASSNTPEINQEKFAAFMPKLNRLYKKYNQKFLNSLSRELKDSVAVFPSLRSVSQLAAMAFQSQGDYEVSNQILSYFEKIITHPELQIDPKVMEVNNQIRANNDLCRWIIAHDGQKNENGQTLFTQEQIFDFRDVFYQKVQQGNESLALYYYTLGDEVKAKERLQCFFAQTKYPPVEAARILWEKQKMLGFQCSIGRDYQDLVRQVIAEKNITFAGFTPVVATPRRAGLTAAKA